MDKNVELSLLYDIYGKQLTKKQKEIFEEYYLYNLSLREIAENKNISFQAVRDSIKKSEELLYGFERNIKMLELKRKYDLLSNTIIENKENLNGIKSKLLDVIREEED